VNDTIEIKEDTAVIAIEAQVETLAVSGDTYQIVLANSSPVTAITESAATVNVISFAETEPAFAAWLAAHPSGSATILSGNDSVVVPLVGMTPTGFVAPFWIGAAQSTIGAVAGTDSFVITVGGKVEGDTEVGFHVVRFA
jgi:hypothetical protein